MFMSILPTKIDILSRFINFNLLSSAYFISVLKSNRFNFSDTSTNPLNVSFKLGSSIFNSPSNNGCLKFPESVMFL